ncbi:MAG TPA: 4Fe-4S dicluster domain-containing protein [Thermodesulfobacteriota bacterium]|nr:4Fe-4S dicluster domain-containing protein [Thermodesulfobacteriota bacterium]
MAIRVNPKLIEEIEMYGAEDVKKCYHCGNCSAACSHSDEPYLIPRRSMRTLQMGLEEKIRSSLEPWLCYYCGQCSEECPRQAFPGETMMSLRRWLTSVYDFTGISRAFYRSWKTEVAAVILLALLTGAGFLWYGFSHGNIRTYDGPTAFLPSSAVHFFDWTMAGVLTFFLIVNAFRMWWFTIGRHRPNPIPLADYVKKAYLLPLHLFTQKRYAQCEHKGPWAIHLVLVLSYMSLFVLIMFFLADVQGGPAINWNFHVIGYLASAGLIGATVYAIYGRIRKTQVHYQRSHESDWIFLFLLLFVGVTGVLQHVLHRTGMDVAANLMYVTHMMGVVPMLCLEVPFSKWTHLLYRPLAMYLSVLAAPALARAPRNAGLPYPTPMQSKAA